VAAQLLGEALVYVCQEYSPFAASLGWGSRQRDPPRRETQSWALWVLREETSAQDCLLGVATGSVAHHAVPHPCLSAAAVADTVAARADVLDSCWAVYFHLVSRPQSSFSCSPREILLIAGMDELGSPLGGIHKKK
jgi:hypothetical protein